MNVQTALLQGVGLLEDAGIGVPRLTAEVLLAHALREERTHLYAHPEQELSELQWLHYGRYLHERLGGKPTQYITGRQEFYGREFSVTKDVLIPRPETEHVVEAALRCGAGLWACSRASARRAGQKAGGSPEGLPHILDVGTGSGALAVTLALETGAVTLASDISPAAAAVAENNARRLGARVNVLVCDVMAAVRPGSIDVIVSNPPYVPAGDRDGLQREVRDWEPHVALFAGDTGFEIYERIVDEATRVLRPGGRLVMELGFGSRDRVVALLQGWTEIRVDPDLAGIPRVISARCGVESA